ncbi:MAG: GNAT family N-acetyltransferase [Pseudomonadota bacterium]|nr:GNAT family N-acetyltransferase [Pseudomonadota bacterium]
MSHPFETDLLVAVEEAGINASAPREQLWVDGWLVRFSPGKAKRARCIQAVAPGRLSVTSKLERCMAIYASAGLRPYVRVTPFSQPAHLDQQLADFGMERLDDTRVMVAAMPVLSGAEDETANVTRGLRFQTVDAAAFAQWIGVLRGSSAAECRAHAERLRDAPVPHCAVLVVDPDGDVVAGGQVAVEGSLAGLYDILTTEAARNRGIADALCRHLLERAGRLGASTAYLQVDAGNEVARRLYRRLGFQDSYAYHYRTPPAR